MPNTTKTFSKGDRVIWTANNNTPAVVVGFVRGAVRVRVTTATGYKRYSVLPTGLELAGK
jgi:hypothetical protein